MASGKKRVEKTERVETHVVDEPVVTGAAGQPEVAAEPERSGAANKPAPSGKIKVLKSSLWGKEICLACGKVRIDEKGFTDAKFFDELAKFYQVSK